MKPAKDLEGIEIADAMKADDLRAKVRHIFQDWSAKIEQASQQRNPPSVLEIRRMELIAAEQIIEAVKH